MPSIFSGCSSHIWRRSMGFLWKHPTQLLRSKTHWLHPSQNSTTSSRNHGSPSGYTGFCQGVSAHLLFPGMLSNYMLLLQQAKFVALIEPVFALVWSPARKPICMVTGPSIGRGMVLPPVKHWCQLRSLHLPNQRNAPLVEYHPF